MKCSECSRLTGCLHVLTECLHVLTGCLHVLTVDIFNGI